MSTPEEIFDVCDEHDRVIGQAPRSVVHANAWLHRAVHIFVFNSQGQFLLHRRSAKKDQSPLTYTSSASGHLSAGESYDEAAPREVEEELGLTGPLERLATFPATFETAFEHTVLYRLVTDDAPIPNTEEIESLEIVSLDEVKRRLAENPGEFSSPFRVLLLWYFEHQANATRRSQSC
jgi:16S rRNA (adenine1518-N6/adenine1519-N6)-dimethyltransferase